MFTPRTSHSCFAVTTCFLAILAFSPSLAVEEVYTYGEFPGLNFRLGDGFVANGDTTVTVVHKGFLPSRRPNDVGSLYFVDPRSGNEVFLFRNLDENDHGKVIDLGRFPRGTPIVFKYVNDSRAPHFARYTGANDTGSYVLSGLPSAGMWIDGKPRFRSGDDWPNATGEYRWAVAARISNSTVQFQFEDATDMHFNDILFQVTGVLLDSERRLGAPRLPAGTVFEDSFTVRIDPPEGTVDPDTRLYYTTDGSDPGWDLQTGEPKGATQIYSRPFTVHSTTQVKAIAWKPPEPDPVTGGFIRYSPSAAVSAEYTRDNRAGVTSAAYLDVDGDGRLDRIRIRLEAHPVAPPDTLELDAPAGGGKIVLEAAGARITGSLLEFTLPGLPVGTSVPAGARGHFRSPGFHADAFAITDSAGPVLVQALSRTLGNGQRSLSLRFSETLEISAAARAFPYATKRGNVEVSWLQVDVASITRQSASEYRYTFASDVYPVPGDSLRILRDSLPDLFGNRSRMAAFIEVEGEPTRLPAPIGVEVEGHAVGPSIEAPSALRIPVSVVAPSGSPEVPGECLECVTGEWKALDPSRPERFPHGPSLHVTVRTPFKFNLRFFDHLGGFVNAASGKVTAAMLQHVDPDEEGNRTIELLWYPVSESGHQVGTGAYIAKGELVGTPDDVLRGPQGEPAEWAREKKSVLLRFGYVRAR